MAEYKPLGSEKLGADEKLKRILELAYYNNNKKSSSNKAELVSESKTGGVYGIVKEKDGYYVKRGLNESSLDYIGGMFMKNKNKFSSYAEAYKRLDLLKGQEELNEATKYVLKQKPPMETEAAPMPMAEPESAPAPAAAPAPAPAADPSMVPADTSNATAPVDQDAPAADAPDMSGVTDLNSMGGTDQKDDSDKSDMRSSYMEEIQKFAGKLGQELRDQHERLESDDIKYVLNMIISAVNLDKLSDEDMEELGKKFDREDKEEGGEKTPVTEPTAKPAPAAPSAETDLGEDAMTKLDEFINSPQLGEVDLSDYSLGEEDETANLDNHSVNHDKESSSDSDWWEDDGLGHGGEQETDMDEKEIDLDEIKDQISRAVGETLSKHFS
jgi:hypothetical protein